MTNPSGGADSPFITVFVESVSGYKAHERPTAFVYEGRRFEIAEISDRWYEGGLDPARPVINYFKVKTVEGEVFLLRYLSLFDDWSAMPASSGFGGT